MAKSTRSKLDWAILFLSLLIILTIFIPWIIDDAGHVFWSWQLMSVFSTNLILIVFANWLAAAIIFLATTWTNKWERYLIGTITGIVVLVVQIGIGTVNSVEIFRYVSDKFSTDTALLGTGIFILGVVCMLCLMGLFAVTYVRSHTPAAKTGGSRTEWLLEGVLGLLIGLASILSIIGKLITSFSGKPTSAFGWAWWTITIVMEICLLTAAGAAVVDGFCLRHNKRGFSSLPALLLTVVTIMAFIFPVVLSFLVAQTQISLFLAALMWFILFPPALLSCCVAGLIVTKINRKIRMKTLCSISPPSTLGPIDWNRLKPASTLLDKARKSQDGPE